MSREAHPLALAKLKYARHRAQSKFRNIPFNLTFDEWYNWWLSNGVDKNQDPLPGTPRWCMCRINDQGPYALGNVYFADNAQNASDAHRSGAAVGRTPKPIYRWGNRMVDIRELRELAPEGFNASHYLAREYDKHRNTEARQLRNRLIKEHGTLRSRTQYRLHDSQWYPTLKDVSEKHGMDPSTYKKRLRQGTPGYESRVTITLEQWMWQHTRYPDPIIYKE
jgi:hypothetical protein